LSLSRKIDFGLVKERHACLETELVKKCTVTCTKDARTLERKYHALGWYCRSQSREIVENHRASCTEVGLGEG
jgi:hypothetical protein